MMRFRSLACLALLCCLLLLMPDRASAVLLRGFTGLDPKHSSDGYQYVTFGRYPYEKDGTEAPVLWRVLGPGTPGEDDVINEGSAPPRKWKKAANTDAPGGEDADVYCLMSEYILDMVLYHDVKDTDRGPALDYVDSLMYQSMNGDFLGRLFTPEEQAVLVWMPQRGLLGLPTRKGELFRADYGFTPEDFTEWQARRAVGTPYAYGQGLKRIAHYSWYFTADWRRYGSRWIVGDNGHISVSGVNRKGGVRPVCYVHADRLQALGGSGTMEDPLRLQVR